jgi:SAM-dependent methyltransferase
VNSKAPSCPICKGRTRRLFRKDGYWINRCHLCRHDCAEISHSEDHVLKVYGDHYFYGGGAGYPGYMKEAPLLRARGQHYADLLRHYLKPGALLDVGAAAGFILQGFLDCGWEGKGIEPNDRMAEYARSHLKIEVETGTLEDTSHETSYDLISMIQVVGHFLDPRQAFGSAGKLTRPGGYWLIETWDPESWTATLFGKHWHAYSPPSVLHWFSRRALRRLLLEFGFHEVAHGRAWKWLNAAHAKSVLQYHLGPRATRALELVPDQMRFPYPGDDPFWALFRKAA